MLLSDKEGLESENAHLLAQEKETRRKCAHLEKTMEVHDCEGRQAIEFVVAELTQIDGQLKGDHNVLQQVISKVEDLLHCEAFGGAGMGSGNPVVLVLYEVLEIFKVMMRQLKVTQKEMKKRVLN